MSWVPPRRVTSTPTSISVTSAGAMSTLEYEASIMAPGEYKWFLGANLNTQLPHPSHINPSTGIGYMVDVTEDGLSEANTAIDWAGKGCYDHIGKQVMWASTGQGSQGVAGTKYQNTWCFYDEMHDNGDGTTGRWDVIREQQCPGDDDVAWMHMFDKFTLDFNRRRLYLQKFHNPASIILMADIDTKTWLGTIRDPIQDNFLRQPALEYIESIGNNGAIWAWTRRNDGTQCLEEHLIPDVEVFLPTEMPTSSNWRIINTPVTPCSTLGLPMSYNPRSHKVLCGGQDAKAYIYDCNPPYNVTVVDTSSYNTTWTIRFDGHLCADPAGDGWLNLSSNGNMYRFRADGSFTNLGRNPGLFGTVGLTGACVMTPLHPYGVVWVVGERYYWESRGAANLNERAFLYKPPTQV